MTTMICIENGGCIEFFFVYMYLSIITMVMAGVAAILINSIWEKKKDD